MFLTQLVGCATAALIVLVLWLGVELRYANRRADWLEEDVYELRRDMAVLYDRVENRDVM